MRNPVMVNCKVIWMVASLVVMAATSYAIAQAQGSGRSAPPPSRPSPPPQQPGGKGPHTATNDEALCRLIKLECIDELDDHSVAKLVVKPVGKNTKVLKLAVAESDKPFIRLCRHEFDVQDAQDLLRDGLFCRVKWRYEPTEDNRKPKSKELVDIRLVPFEVHGKIVRIEGGYVTLWARPTNNADWPQLAASEQSSTIGRAKHPRRTLSKNPPRNLRLRLRTIDDITIYRDRRNQELGVDDFAKGQEVTATVILGQKEGILVTLQALTAEE